MSRRCWRSEPFSRAQLTCRSTGESHAGCRHSTVHVSFFAMIRPSKMSSRLLIGTCLAACLSACGDDSSGTSSNTAGMAAAGSGPMSSKCSADYLDFSVGPASPVTSNAESGVAVRVLDGPVPPEFGYNTWTIQILDASTMEPMPNARLTWQCSFMSVHGHGSNPKAVENLGNGQYKLTNQNLRMLGPWEVQFWIDPSGAMPEYVPTSNIISGMACNPTSGLQGKPTIEIKVCVPDSSG